MFHDRIYSLSQGDRCVCLLGAPLMAGAACIPIQALTKQWGCDQQRRPFSTAVLPVRAVGKETVAVCHREQVLFLSLGMKASSLVTRPQFSSCHHLQAALSAVQTSLIKILWQMKGMRMCLLLNLFVYWVVIFTSFSASYLPHGWELKSVIFPFPISPGVAGWRLWLLCCEKCNTGQSLTGWCWLVLYWQ